MTLVFSIGACEGTGTSGDSGGKSAQTSSPLSPETYRATLAAVTAPINKALAKLRAAGSIKGLAARVTAVEQAANQAVARLERLAPPPGLAAEHARLTAALRQFDGELRAVENEVAGRDLCASSSVRAQLGRSGAAAALRTAVAAMAAKAPGDRISLQLPAARRDTTRRPSNGHFVRSGGRGGRGTLTIDNTSGSPDAVVTLAKGKRSIISVYVRRKRKFKVTGINDGTYKVFYVRGTDWDDKARWFARECEFQRFDDTFKFRTITTATQIRWDTWEITLHPVVGGKASTSDVDPGDYPDT
ncbi:MAG TPA: hypothetical protein VFU43_20160 [Streptosporangiaceae bacterium]|nr:hypothetical protein [Streptosporangiaceae bacterium]